LKPCVPHEKAADRFSIVETVHQGAHGGFAAQSLEGRNFGLCFVRIHKQNRLQRNTIQRKQLQKQ